MDKDNSLVGNPLFAPWTGPFEAPPFDRIRPSDFEPAFQAALASAQAEVAAIAANPDPPSFENTIEALERSGRDLDRVSSVFFNLAAADTNEELQSLEREIAPRLARHHSEIYLNEALFQRIAALHGRRSELGLEPEQMRVLDRYYTAFIRNGGGLPEASKARLAEISERLATLGTKFGKMFSPTKKTICWFSRRRTISRDFPLRSSPSRRRTATDRGLPGKHGITLSRSSIEPFLQFSARRDLREKAFTAWARRGETGGVTDNRAHCRRNGAAARRARPAPRT